MNVNGRDYQGEIQPRLELVDFRNAVASRHWPFGQAGKWLYAPRWVMRRKSPLIVSLIIS